jgi:hypothetical protein
MGVIQVPDSIVKVSLAVPWTLVLFILQGIFFSTFSSIQAFQMSKHLDAIKANVYRKEICSRYYYSTITQMQLCAEN